MNPKAWSPKPIFPKIHFLTYDSTHISTVTTRHEQLLSAAPQTPLLVVSGFLILPLWNQGAEHFFRAPACYPQHQPLAAGSSPASLISLGSLQAGSEPNTFPSSGLPRQKFWRKSISLSKSRGRRHQGGSDHQVAACCCSCLPVGRQHLEALQGLRGAAKPKLSLRSHGDGGIANISARARQHSGYHKFTQTQQRDNQWSFSIGVASERFLLQSERNLLLALKCNLLGSIMPRAIKSKVLDCDTASLF